MTVSRFIAGKTSAELVRRVPALETNRQTVDSTVEKVVATDQFKSILGQAVAVAETRLVNGSDDNSAMKLKNVGNVISEQLATVDPELAKQVPDGLDAKIASLSEVPALAKAVRTLKTIKYLGVILPPIAVLVLIGSILVAPDRRAAVGRLGVTLAAAAVILFLAAGTGRAFVLDAVPSGIDRDAAGGVWDEVIGPFGTWLIVAFASGLALLAGAVMAGRANRSRPAY